MNRNRGRRISSYTTIRVTYSDSDRVDIHYNLSHREVSMIEFLPYASVEVIEVSTRRVRYNKEYK